MRIDYGLQFSSNARFTSWRGGTSGVDINAFYGTSAELQALFHSRTPKETPLTSGDLILDQLVGPVRDKHGHTFSGWPQLGGRTLVDAIAAIGHALDIKGFKPKS